MLRIERYDLINDIPELSDEPLNALRNQRIADLLREHGIIAEPEGDEQDKELVAA